MLPEQVLADACAKLDKMHSENISFLKGMVEELQGTQTSLAGVVEELRRQIMTSSDELREENGKLHDLVKTLTDEVQRLQLESVVRAPEGHVKREVVWERGTIARPL